MSNDLNKSNLLQTCEKCERKNTCPEREQHIKDTFIKFFGEDYNEYDYDKLCIIISEEIRQRGIRHPEELDKVYDIIEKTDKPIYKLDSGFNHLSISERKVDYYEIPFEEAKDIVGNLDDIPMVLYEIVFDNYCAIPIPDATDGCLDSAIAFPEECITIIPISND